MLSVNSEVKMIYLQEESNNNLVTRSHMKDILENLELTEKGNMALCLGEIPSVAFTDFLIKHMSKNAI